MELTTDDIRAVTYCQNTIQFLAQLSHGIVNGKNSESQVITFKNACDNFERLKGIVGTSNVIYKKPDKEIDSFL